MRFFIFVLGLIIGSFLNVCIYRIPIDISIITPLSICKNCETKLKPIDLFPVISWICLKRKCRYCGKSISIRYMMIELFTGILFSILFHKIGFDLVLIPYFILLSILIVISFIDLDYYIIPNKVILFALIIFMVLNVFLKYIEWKDAFLGAFIGGAFLLFIAVVTGGMGMGDVKLMTVIGLYLGWKNIIISLFLSFIIGGVFGTGLLIFKVKGRKDAIPFGPWIALATYITMVTGSGIMTWYIGLFF